MLSAFGIVLRLLGASPLHVNFWLAYFPANQEQRWSWKDPFLYVVDHNVLHIVHITDHEIETNHTLLSFQRWYMAAFITG